MPTSRQQLSLFVPDEAAPALEAVRRAVDPIQHGLIPAHVTLCREDELSDWPPIHARLRTLDVPRFCLSFGRAERFHGHGLILHCLDGQPAFRALREHVLGSPRIREQPPHITLAHPRNPRAPGNALDYDAQLPERLSVTFDSVRRIEQHDSQPWLVLERFPLR